MSATNPWLVVRARVQPARLEEFRDWYRRVHLPHAMAIPGIVGYRGLVAAPGAEHGAPNVLSVFLLKDESVIQTALQSREAGIARRDWENWAESVRDLSVQIYAGLDTRAAVRHIN